MSFWTKIGTFFGGNKVIQEVIGEVGNILDESITNKEELAAAQAKLNKTLTDNSKAFIDARKEILLAEVSGSKLQRAWRPITMIMFAFIVVYQYFLGPLLGTPIVEDIDPRFWDLLEIGLLGYTGLRSGEKIVSNIITYKKKKRAK